MKGFLTATNDYLVRAISRASYGLRASPYSDLK
jgi:hypothetical protein